MNILIVISLIILSLALITAVVLIFTVRYFFRLTILRKPTATLENNINANTDWNKHIDFIIKRREWLEAQSITKESILSFDGFKLCGYAIKSKNPVKKAVICFHGYTSCAMSNFGSYVKFYNENGVDVLMVDARAHGESQGKYIGFGVLDRKDAEKWVSYAVDFFGSDYDIYLHGVSMGGATVLMASGLDLPENVKGIIADCAFTSAYDVFKHILKRDYHMPAFPLMNLTDIVTRRYAGYGYKDVNTKEELNKTNIPVLFIHGDKDDFVPTFMTYQNYEACNSPKKLFIVKNADHAEAYYCDREGYEQNVLELMNL